MKNYKVYKHTFPNAKVYIGITSYKNVNYRWQNGKGYKTQEFMRKAIEKYGWDNIKHEVLFENLTKEQAEHKEIELISLYKSCNKNYGYNVDNGGCHIGCHSKATRNKMSVIARHQYENGRIGNNKNKKLSSETKKRISESQKARHDKCRVLFVELMKINKKERKPNIKTKNKPTRIGKGRRSRIICFDTNKTYDSIKQAGLELNIDTSAISHCCLGNRKTAGGFKWGYLDKEEKAKDYDSSNYTCRKIKCIEENRVFNSIYEASIYCVGKKTSNICNCLNGRCLTAYGRHWVYVDV